MAEQTPWKNGIYALNSGGAFLIKVEGRNIQTVTTAYLDFPDVTPVFEGSTWNHGDFGPAKKEVVEASGGIKNFNIEITIWTGVKHKAILNEEGSKIWHWDNGKVNTFKWLSKEDLDEMREDREDIKEASCPYKIQPENKGKLIFLSGPPGAGKSTVAQMMSKNYDFVFYEADSIMVCLNPFVPNEVENPTMAAFRQKPVKGFGRDFLNASSVYRGEFRKMIKGQVDSMDWSNTFPMYKLIAEDIQHQHRRIGGNFVAAGAVPTREIRDLIRKTLPDCIFVVLTLTKETQLKRLRSRHGSSTASEWLSRMYSLYELPDPDEENTFNIDNTEDMSPEQVQDQVLKLINFES